MPKVTAAALGTKMGGKQRGEESVQWVWANTLPSLIPDAKHHLAQVLMQVSQLCSNSWWMRGAVSA